MNCNNLHLDLLIGMFKLIERLFFHLVEKVFHADSRLRQGGDEEGGAVYHPSATRWIDCACHTHTQASDHQELIWAALASIRSRPFGPTPPEYIWTQYVPCPSLV